MWLSFAVHLKVSTLCDVVQVRRGSQHSGRRSDENEHEEKMMMMFGDPTTIGLVEASERILYCILRI